MDPYVLVIGYRQQLAAALARRGIAYSVWSDKPLRKKPVGVGQLISAPFSLHEENLVKLLGAFSLHAPTHVIAGGEPAVLLAAKVGRYFGCPAHPLPLLERCTDKAVMKEFLSSQRIPMTQFIRHSPELTAEELQRILQHPVVIKNRCGSGGRYMIFAETLEEIRAAMGPGQLYEAFVNAPEGSIECFIRGGKVIFSSVTEYFTKKVSNILPASFVGAELQQIHALNQRVIAALGITRGITHLEFYRSDKGLLFGEIALRPPGGYIMELLRRAYDFDPWNLLIDVELGLEHTPVPTKPQGYAACVVLHPGAGTVSTIRKPRVEEIPSLLKCLIKARIGDKIISRVGVSDDVGYCLLFNTSYQQISEDVRRIENDPPLRITGVWQ